MIYAQRLATLVKIPVYHAVEIEWHHYYNNTLLPRAGHRFMLQGHFKWHSILIMLVYYAYYNFVNCVFKWTNSKYSNWSVLLLYDVFLIFSPSSEAGMKHAHAVDNLRYTGDVFCKYLSLWLVFSRQLSCLCAINSVTDDYFLFHESSIGTYCTENASHTRKKLRHGSFAANW